MKKVEFGANGQFGLLTFQIHYKTICKISVFGSQPFPGISFDNPKHQNCAMTCSKALVSALMVFITLSQASSAVAQTIAELRQEPVFNSQFYYQEHGARNKINVVLCHGTGNMASKIWDDIIPVLAKDYHVITFDLPGFGKSEKKNARYSPENYARFLKWLLDTNVNGPIYLVGHSLGGAIALYYAGAYPQNIDRLILVDAAGILYRAALAKSPVKSLLGRVQPLSIFKYWIDTGIESFDSKFSTEKLDSLLDLKTFREKTLGGDPKKISGMALVITDFSKIISQVTTPTFILWGENDGIAPLRTGKLLAYNIPGSVLDVMPELEHNPMLENPDDFTKLLKKDLSRDPGEKKARNKTVTSKRVKRVHSASGVVITGDYKHIEIKRSDEILIKDVNVGRLDIINSEVTIEFSDIQSDHIGLYALDSILNITASSISGGIAILTANSKLDLAGVTLNSDEEPIFSDSNSTIVFSVCRINSKYKDRKFAHQIINLLQGESF